MTYKKTVSPLGKNPRESLPTASFFQLPIYRHFFPWRLHTQVHNLPSAGNIRASHITAVPPALGLAPTVAHKTDPPRKVQPITTNWDRSPQHQRRGKTIGPLTPPTISVLGCFQEPSVFWGWWGIEL